MKLKTGFVWHEIYAWGLQANDAQSNPSECLFEPLPSNEGPEAKRRVRNLLEASGLLGQLERVDAIMPGVADLERVHATDYLERFRSCSAAGWGEVSGAQGPTMLAFRNSWEISLLAAGGTIAAVAAVASGKVQNAYALVRPPGHHARRTEAMGYCFLANAAIAARYAQEKLGVARVAILDWDVHHGNGAQEIFYQDPSVLTISLHQEGAYPYNTGTVDETGEAEGIGSNLNIPLPAGSGDGAYAYAFDSLVIPALEKFRPELIIVSCGFDAANGDNTGRMMLHSGSFREMTRKLMDCAARLCQGRLVFTHEGGYNPATVPYLALAVIEELSGHRTTVVDPFEPVWRQAPGQALYPHQRAKVDHVARHARTLGMLAA
ncbi:class II histone deacetylase [Variovorax sp. LT1R20]|uniref:class II histone deacetylase n=1 Tax=Variovorax sp. LT1R20 TaxID=3443729 RepID=UPI003F45E91D